MEGAEKEQVALDIIAPAVGVCETSIHMHVDERFISTSNYDRYKCQCASISMALVRTGLSPSLSHH